MIITIIGVILAVAGVGMTIGGFAQNNSAEAQLKSLFSTGKANPGTPLIIIGIIVAIVGAAILIYGLSKRNGSKG